MGELTAQETFKTMMKEQVAPALRALGFNGSGQRYELSSETHWALLGFQKSTGSDASQVKFTINVSAVPRDEWEEARRKQAWLAERPGANVSEFVGWHARIGELTGASDTWWTVSADRPTEPVVSEVIAAVRDHALTELRRRIDGVESRP